ARHGYALAWAPLVEAALHRRRGEERRAQEALARRGAAGEHATGITPRPPGVAVLLQLFDLRRRPPGTTDQGKQPETTKPAGLAEDDCDLVVDLRRGVIRAPRTGQRTTRRPLLCELLAHLHPGDAAYSAE